MPLFVIAGHDPQSMARVAWIPDRVRDDSRVRHDKR